MRQIVENPMLRARIAAAGAVRLTGPMLTDADPAQPFVSSLWTYLTDLQTYVHATARLVDACTGGDTLDGPLLDLVLVTLQQGNLHGWVQAGGNDLPDYGLLVDALEAEIEQLLATRLAQQLAAGALGDDGQQAGQLSIADEATRTARTLTGGNAVLAAHVMIGASLLALREAC
ncbi:MAG TPA: hypothetical protein VHB98_23460 [Chloroflexota bacterium]|nr:hypothetical protein [Chloroflexota bacterium]